MKRVCVSAPGRPGEPVCPQTAAELQHLQSAFLLPPSSGWPQITSTAAAATAAITLPAGIAGVTGKWDGCQGNSIRISEIFPHS